MRIKGNSLRVKLFLSYFLHSKYQICIWNWLRKIKYHSLWKKTFSIIACNRNFWQVHAYCKKKSTAQPKVFLIGFKTLGFFGCCYTKFAKVQRSHFNSNILHKLLFGMKVSERCLSYVKSYFQAHQLRSYVLMLIWESSRVRVLKQNISKNSFPVKHSSMYLFYMNKIFSNT